MLLSESQLKSLPALYSQEGEEDPVIHIKLVASDRRWACYIAEAGRKNMGYEVFGLFVGKYGQNWGQLPLQAIEEDLREVGIDATPERNFQPARSSVLTGFTRHAVLTA